MVWEYLTRDLPAATPELTRQSWGRVWVSELRGSPGKQGEIIMEIDVVTYSKWGRTIHSASNYQQRSSSNYTQRSLSMGHCRWNSFFRFTTSDMSRPSRIEGFTLLIITDNWNKLVDWRKFIGAPVQPIYPQWRQGWFTHTDPRLIFVPLTESYTGLILPTYWLIQVQRHGARWHQPGAATAWYFSTSQHVQERASTVWILWSWPVVMPVFVIDSPTTDAVWRPISAPWPACPAVYESIKNVKI